MTNEGTAVEDTNYGDDEHPYTQASLAVVKCKQCGLSIGEQPRDKNHSHVLHCANGAYHAVMAAYNHKRGTLYLFCATCNEGIAVFYIAKTDPTAN